MCYIPNTCSIFWKENIVQGRLYENEIREPFVHSRVLKQSPFARGSFR